MQLSDESLVEQFNRVQREHINETSALRALLSERDQQIESLRGECGARQIEGYRLGWEARGKQIADRCDAIFNGTGDENIGMLADEIRAIAREGT